MSRTPRIPPAEVDGPLGFLVKRFSRKVLGDVPEALGVLWNHRPALKASMSYGRKVEQWHVVDPTLKTFAHMAVAAQVGCSWCLDYNYFKAHNEGLDERRASEVPRWRESDVFGPLERDVLEYAEAMTATPPEVTDELSARLLDALGPAGLVELTSVIAFANSTTRGNVAMGIESQGFSAACELPLARPSAAHATAP